MQPTVSSAKVISLAAYHEQMQFPALHEAEAYWEGLRLGRDMPFRAEVDPRGLARVLEQAIVIERIADGLARFRVAGHAVSKVLGMDARGMPLSTMIAPDDRPQLAGWLEQLFDTPAKLRLTLFAERGLGKPDLSGQLLMLPLRDDQGGVSRALGILATKGNTGRTPRRFRIMTHRLTPITQTGDTGRSRTKATPPPRPIRTEKGPDKRPALCLVKSDD